jgi:ATP-dependent DNA helicase RecG
MSKPGLQFFINQGEGYNLEFKEAFSDRIAVDFCAFANATGGKLILGISDDGQVRGVSLTNRLKSQIQDLARHLDPPVAVEILPLENVIAVDIPEGGNKPYSANGKFFLRIGPNSQQLGRDEIRRFFQEEGLILFDEKPNPDFSLDKDFSLLKFREFLKKARISRVLETKDLLSNLSLLADGRLKNAGVLLFARQITRFFIQATITSVLYQGQTKYKVLDRKEFDKDIFSNYQDALIYLQSKLNTEYIIGGGPRVEKLELPEDALREGLLNVIAHRNYFVSGAGILVEIFSDRVEVTNPGGLVKGLTIKDLGRKSLSRNNLLFGLMQRMDLVEKIGSGILRMRNAMASYGLEGPEFETDENWFTVIFRRRLVSERAIGSEKSSEKSSEKILRIIRENPEISAKKMAGFLGITPRAVEKRLADLKARGFIERIGPAKGGRWVVRGDGG